MMTKILSNFFSAIFHPLLMPLYGFVLLLRTGMLLGFIYEIYQKPIVLTFMAGNILLPLIIIYLLLMLKIVKSIYMEKSRERVLPLLMAAIIYFLTFYWLKNNTQYTHVLQSFLLSITLTVTLTAMISYFWKISIHMVGMGGITGLLFMLCHQMDCNLFVPISLAIFFSGLVGSSRLIAGSHQPAQIYVGYLLGLTAMLAILRF